ncbi:MATE family efflux transporter [Parahaliea maris]|uniref:MATE family efflux transporter n=1 Tax=Parahaliea maris TaxID=2716870 RepID=A0A5C9A264_9GAMM|nr:MATE family efflux transporter [Parahaliea maris]TXS93697.1 MATE family efflux transporter [Parahaliea maris]
MPILTRLDRKIWGIAGPAMLSNISIPLLGLADAAILGHLDSHVYLGAVAIGGALLSFLYWGFGFLRMGTTGLVARAEGAGNTEEGVVVLARSTVLALGIAALIICLHPLLLGVGFALMNPAPEILPLAESYARLRLFSAPAVLTTYAVVGWCIGRQDTRRPLLIVVTTNILNILLDFVLVLGMGMNSDGAALATVIAEYCGLALALWLVWRAHPTPAWGRLGAQLRRVGGYRALLRSNWHLFIRTICLLAAFAFFTAAGDKLGADILAANALMLQLLMFCAHALDGFAFAAEGLSGQLLGADDSAGFRASVARCARWCGFTAVGLTLMLLAGWGVLPAWLTSLPAVRAAMTAHWPWLLLMPLAAGPSYLLDGVFIGTAETRPMMVSMLLSTLLVYLPLWFLTRGWGNHGLWLAFVAFNAARGATLYPAWYRRWGRGRRQAQ